jgi:hypothetical protein
MVEDQANAAGELPHILSHAGDRDFFLAGIHLIEGREEGAVGLSDARVSEQRLFKSGITQWYEWRLSGITALSINPHE